MAETLSYDNTPDTSVLTEEEQNSLEVGKALREEQDQLLAGKYKSAEELEKAYVELQKKLGESDGDETQGEEGESAEETTEEAPEPSPAQSLITDASAEYADKGELSEETMAKFTEMSSQDLVQAYMEMQQNAPEPAQEEAPDLTDAEVNQIKNIVGGEAEYDKVVEWAGKSLTEAQLEAYDSIIAAGNMEAIALMVNGLKAQYDTDNGYEGRMLSGKSADSGKGDVFRSQQEVVEAIADPRYDRDSAYRNDVLEKLERSDVTFR